MRKKTDLPLAALVLVGGYGTRMRPFAFTRSKSLIEFCNKPMVEYLIEALINIGCKKIVLALSTIQPDLSEYIEKYNKKSGGKCTIIPSVEKVPMGTAGPIVLAKEYLDGHRFFMVNSDIICNYKFDKFLSFHMNHDSEGSILGWMVEDGSRFGVIDHVESGLILQFREKPETDNVNCLINGGIYILEPDVIKRVPNEPCSIERYVFPIMAADKQLYVMKHEGFWMDIGTPSSFIEGTKIYLDSMKMVNLIDGSVKYNKSSVKFGKNVVIGPNCVIGDGCQLNNCIVLSGTTIGDNCKLDTCIVGWGCVIHNNCSILEMSMLGEKVVVEKDVDLKNFIICPHRSVNQSLVHSPTQNIIM